jgi:hypothetical protein
MSTSSSDLPAVMKGSDSNMTPVDREKTVASNIDLYIDPARERKLLAKLDLFLTPVIMLVYLCCFLDRSNIGKSISSRTLPF